ncbi:FtsH protease activity modulator HflK [Marinomonas mediterranea]|jgi:protease FtsH subunit HflK|uniref:Protein HflK n=1 Tax=Marinomonas mediterranea (strain ATCC 700492 / JCM 21426 / NBRC 103028 / MMB-1) TaxID=717774 RepID=F2JWL4_MARM1|nr:FtsH protease activity modulator HflK [Marinomonas mediterranea]ADZ91778.1 HflK protein [Marinomonas mediterranea MMB-1]WCN17871.1 FtsH protease activity modulator HflK [Marinomonas mediterranea MMB-1]
MAWNEPGNNDNDPWNPDKNRNSQQGGRDQEPNNDPWGRPNGGKEQSPPDLDEAFRKLMDMLGVKKSNRGGGSSGGDGGFSGKVSGGLLAILIIGLLAVWAASGVYQVDQQERGVVLRLGKYHSTVMPGLHWNPPMIDSVSKVNVTKVRSHDHKALMLTVDEAIVEVGVSVQYSVENPKDFLLNVRTPEESLSQAVESSLRHVVGSSEMDQILTEGRELLATEVKVRLQDYINAYGTGLLISKVNVENTQAPEQVKEAFDDVIKAKEDEQRVRNEAESYANGIIPEARGKSQRIREEAEAYRSEVVARAEGQADRFDRLYQEYVKAPAVTKRRLYLETVETIYKDANKVVIDDDGGNNMMYLPLDQILKNQNSANPISGSLNSDDISSLTDQVLNELRMRQGSSVRREGRN